jgi:hypothetical protein
VQNPGQYSVNTIEEWNGGVETMAKCQCCIQIHLISARPHHDTTVASFSGLLIQCLEIKFSGVNRLIYYIATIVSEYPGFHRYG